MTAPASRRAFLAATAIAAGAPALATARAEPAAAERPEPAARSRVSNWLMNGATGTSSTETGAYTLNDATSGNAPAVNPGATFYVPMEDQWYKAAFYKGGGTNAGYWDYATQSDTVPTAVTAGSTGIGSSGSAGNFANYNSSASWNGQTGNVTTVGTNGGANAYGAIDMSGNAREWNDLTGSGGAGSSERQGPGKT